MPRHQKLYWRHVQNLMATTMKKWMRCKLNFHQIWITTANELLKWTLYDGLFGGHYFSGPFYIITVTSHKYRGVSNHRQLRCLFRRLFRRISQKTSKPCFTGLREGNPPVTGKRSNAENVSISWSHLGNGWPCNLLPEMWNCGLRMRREYRERFPRRRLQRKPLVSDPGMHHGTWATHVRWCMSG